MKLSNLLLIFLVSTMVCAALSKKSHLRNTEKHHHALKKQGHKLHAPQSSAEWRTFLNGEQEKSDCKPIYGRKDDNGGILRKERILQGKHIDMNKVRISSGYAAYYLDLTDALFLKTFKDNLQTAFKAFTEINQKSKTTLNIYESQEKRVSGDTNKYLNYVQIAEGMYKFGWKGASEAKEIIQKYDLNGDYLINFKEFCYMNILENIKFGPSTSTQNGLNKIKTELYDFFDFIDCDKDGFISAENIFVAFKNIKTEFPCLASFANDFVLKTMELSSATLDVKDFAFGQLLGMFERIVGTHAIDEVELNKVKAIRKTNALKGGIENNGEGAKCGQ